MGHELLRNPFVWIGANGTDVSTAAAWATAQGAGGTDLSEHVRAVGLPMGSRDTVEHTTAGKANAGRSFLLSRPNYTLPIRFAADFDANLVDATLRPLWAAGVDFAMAVRRIKEDGNTQTGTATNQIYTFNALLPSYAGFESVDIETLLEVSITVQINGLVNVLE